MKREIQLSFGAGSVRALEELQHATGATTLAEVVRRALGIYQWALEQVEQGYSVGAFREGAEVKELVLSAKNRQAHLTVLEVIPTSGREGRLDAGLRS